MAESQPEGEQSRFLNSVFNTVAPRYDLINVLMTFGMDRRWRKLAARECVAANPARVLDVCCGTGDLSITIAGLCGDDTGVFGMDYTEAMLEKARGKAGKLADKITFVIGDVTAIPFPDNHFDCLGISFGFRNLTHQNPMATKYLKEILRVLKSGGRFVILESSQPRPTPRIVNCLHGVYVRQFVPRLGAIVSGDAASYRYLSSSVAAFLSPEKLAQLLLESGFTAASFRRLFFGAAAIHVAVK
jgi:demethylmenaquinone methyltransferase/2-methoxy-6-polyprenyl-1,4-benzoquinol methylase